MKIKVKDSTYEQVMALPTPKAQKPKRPNILFRSLLKILGKGDLRKTNFTYRMIGMERLGKSEPCLILMNHSAFIDLEIATSIMYPRPMNIVCTSDGFVGKNWLMRNLGCIPTKKFITDVQLVKDILYAVRTLKDSILMYPEASYSFDGTATPLPEGLGKLIAKLGIPVIMIRTYGAFHRDPLYNGLRLRKVDVSAEVEYLISPEQCKQWSVEQINSCVQEKFSFDNFRWQIDNRIKVSEPFRAEGLSRVLYKCPTCGAEGKLKASGSSIRCESCNKEHELSEYGELIAKDGIGTFRTVPEWYSWERACVRKELEAGTYRLDIPVSISVVKDTKAVYRVGEGRLVHTEEGFHLTGCNGKLDFKTTPMQSYSLYSDYFWYELGDVICIGDANILYYCFPIDCTDIVAKTRLATEELYKLKR